MMSTSLKTLLAIGVLTYTVSLAQGEMLYTASGSFGKGDPLNSSGAFSQEHEVQVTAGVELEVVARSEADLTIEAVFPDGTTLMNDDYEGLNPGFVRTISESGVMRLVVAPLSAGVFGEYELFVEQVETAMLGMNETVTGVLGAQNGGRMVYRLVGTEGSRVVLDLMSDDFDAYLEVVDEDGGEYSDDDSGGDLNSRLSYVFGRDGAITITARSLSGTDEGAFTLQAQTAEVDLLGEFRGTLLADGPRGHDGRLLSRHEFEGNAGDTVSITLESDDFDTVLFVNLPNGRSLGMNDDEGDGTNSKLDVVLPEDGVYVLYVSAYDEDGEGDYVVRIIR
jgi:hypothetical protein